ncbi:DUF5329 domain-containing protein [Aestuariicella hydrocarbonica]|uniref:DUF5329 domain-containing protein n=1 Tax=Pseudomaricurvus hydrocarbonicus TaxID=1470433 RepID=A0A9E5JXN2_9GAMM|nr:DUF5329 family protein [Aestuariicella hydrocarbonica]NHO66435.1 DUF5329 domain-containing protein [Aestuariicella hydrocarbonica]
MLLSTEPLTRCTRLTMLLATLFLSSLFLAAPPSRAYAGETEEDIAARQEIDYLIRYIAESNATFTRNGSDHTAKDAAEHLAMKYRRAARYARTAEDFIDNLASKSSITRKPYTVVTADGKQLTSHDWLYNALKEYRQHDRQ